MYRRYGTCNKCKKQLKTYSKIEKIAEIKFNFLLQKHYKKEHGMNMFKIIIHEKLKKIINNKILKL